jgi:hypothetical protein
MRPAMLVLLVLVVVVLLVVTRLAFMVHAAR